MEIVIEGARQATDGVISAAQQVRSDYRSDWDDPVHDSFQGYIEESEGEISRMRDGMDALVRARTELEPVSAAKLEERLREIEGD